MHESFVILSVLAKQTTIQDKIKFKLDANYQILMNDYALNMQYFERWMRLQFN